MSRPRPEPVQVVKQRRDTALAALLQGIPYARFLNITFDRRGDELTAVLNFQDMLIGNPTLPAIHGGVTAAFLEVASIVTLSWSYLWPDIESGELDLSALTPATMPRLPKTIGITVDYLRSGLPRDAYARATITRSGRRYASVQAESWQDNRDRPFAQATGRFLMPQPKRAQNG
ncbi:PaaI family thioesterase [Arenibacterium halophilum]|uniref:PaaI family thioesterase n=1 Tax=Arenibacterium halophilum TaxID=2583821 RepID=A0ABY2X952_9RHOB|nr:PaaI family thioesterase [Arenibacterium halophilum]TMV12899.1 PaaI family thioesterase [Arenibacterium halophilum]